MKEGNGWKKVESGTLHMECANSHKWTANIRFLGTGDFRCPQCGAQGGLKNVEKP